MDKICKSNSREQYRIEDSKLTPKIVPIYLGARFVSN